MSHAGGVHYRSHSCIPGLKRAGCSLRKESLIPGVNIHSNMGFSSRTGDYGTETVFLKPDKKQV